VLACVGHDEVLHLGDVVLRVVLVLEELGNLASVREEEQ